MTFRAIGAQRFALALLVAVIAPMRAEAQTDWSKKTATLATSAKSDTTRRAPEVRPTAQQQQATNPRLLPDISAVGDLIADLTRSGSTQEDGARFSVREVELALQAAVDPYFRGDVFLGLSDVEGIAIEQAFLTTTALPYAVEARLGRFLMPVGKINTTHRHDLHTIDYPYVIGRFIGEEGLKGTGVYVSRIFAPLGFYQEILLTAVDRFGEPSEDLEDLEPEEPSNKELGGLGYSARLRNYWDISQSSNFELSASAVTGRRAQPLVLGEGPAFGAVNARQTLFGVDLTYRWRPLQQGLYKSFILQAEVLHQINESDPDLPDGVPLSQFGGPTRNFTGAYAFARLQITRRGYLGSRFDWLQDPELDGGQLRAISGYYEFFPSEFSKLLAAFERVMPEGGDGSNRVLFQATFALGPHKPHPF
jgi:hypothetical protein